MISAYCPGHITCFFQPSLSDKPEKSGSRGAGIKISAGTEVSMEFRDDGNFIATMDGKPADVPVTRRTAEILAPGQGMDVIITNYLPVGQGFGTSASGSIALAMCICEKLNIPKEKGYFAAHVAEVERGGGLGDVDAIMQNGHQPVRVEPGLYPIGKTIDTGIVFSSLSLAVFSGPLNTGSVLKNPQIMESVSSTGKDVVNKYLEDPTEEKLFELSNIFSRSAGLETDQISNAILKLKEKGFHAGMCMLGHSIFTDAPEDILKASVPDAEIYSCSSYGDSAKIIRRA